MEQYEENLISSLSDLTKWVGVIDEAIRLIRKLVDENRALCTKLLVNGRPKATAGGPGTGRPAGDQQAKADAGKPRLTLVPPRIIWDIAAVRQYGVEVKYPETGVDGWRTIGLERIQDAAARHFLRYLSDPAGRDPESGLPHLWHLACNVAFLCELEPGPPAGGSVRDVPGSGTERTE